MKNQLNGIEARIPVELKPLVSSLREGTLRFLITLGYHMGPGGRCSPSLKVLMSDTGLSRRGIQNARNELAKHGLGWKKRSRESTVYSWDIFNFSTEAMTMDEKYLNEIENRIGIYRSENILFAGETGIRTCDPNADLRALMNEVNDLTKKNTLLKENLIIHSEFIPPLEAKIRQLKLEIDGGPRDDGVREQGLRPLVEVLKERSRESDEELFRLRRAAREVCEVRFTSDFKILNERIEGLAQILDGK